MDEEDYGDLPKPKYDARFPLLGGPRNRAYSDLTYDAPENSGELMADCFRSVLIHLSTTLSLIHIDYDYTGW